MPFTVIQGQRFWYQWKARTCDFPCVNNGNLPPTLHRFRDMTNYWSHFRYRQGVPLFNALVWKWISIMKIAKFGLKKLETPLCRMVWSVFQYLEPFRRERRTARHTLR